MVCQVKNNQGYKIKAVFDGGSLLKFKLRDSQHIRCKDAVSIVMNKKLLDWSDSSQISALEEALLEPKKINFHVKKQNGKITVIFEHKGEGKKRTITLGGVGAVICGLVAIVTVPFWVTSVGTAAAVTFTSTVVIGAGCKVVSYAYNTPAKEFSDKECVLESLKGGVKGGFAGGCAAGGVLLTPSLGAVAPIIAGGAAGGGAEVARQMLHPKWNKKKLLAESAAGVASSGTNTAARRILDKIPLGKIASKVISVVTKSKVKDVFVNAITGAFVGGFSAAARCITNNYFRRKELDRELKVNVIAGMKAGVVLDVLNSTPLDADSAAAPLKAAAVNGSSTAVRTITRKRLTGKEIKPSKLLFEVVQSAGTGATKSAVKLNMAS